MKLQTIHNLVTENGYNAGAITDSAFDINVNGFTFRVDYSSMGYQVSNGMNAQTFNDPMAVLNAVILLASFADTLSSDY